MEKYIGEISLIKKIVADYYKMGVEDMISHTRFLHICRPRQVAMWVCHYYTNFSLKHIGNGFNNRDHTTVIYAYKKIDNLLENDEKFNKDIENILCRYQGFRGNIRLSKHEYISIDAISNITKDLIGIFFDNNASELKSKLHDYLKGELIFSDKPKTTPVPNTKAEPNENQNNIIEFNKKTIEIKPDEDVGKLINKLWNVMGDVDYLTQNLNDNATRDVALSRLDNSRRVLAELSNNIEDKLYENKELEIC